MICNVLINSKDISKYIRNCFSKFIFYIVRTCLRIYGYTTDWLYKIFRNMFRNTEILHWDILCITSNILIGSLILIGSFIEPIKFAFPSKVEECQLKICNLNLLEKRSIDDRCG